MKWDSMSAILFPYLYLFRRSDRLYNYPNSLVENAMAHQLLSIRTLKTIQYAALMYHVCVCVRLTD